MVKKSNATKTTKTSKTSKTSETSKTSKTSKTPKTPKKSNKKETSNTSKTTGLKYETMVDKTTKALIKIKGVKITHKNGKTINPKHIHKLYDELLQEYDSNEIMIRAVAPDRTITLKGINDDKLNFKSREEYLAGRVAETTKFSEFLEVQVSVRILPTKDDISKHLKKK